MFEKQRAASAAGRRERVESLHHRNTELHTAVCVSTLYCAKHYKELCVCLYTVLCKSLQRTAHDTLYQSQHCAVHFCVLCTVHFRLVNSACASILSATQHFTVLECTVHCVVYYVACIKCSVQ